MDFWDLERALWQTRGPGPTDTLKYTGQVQHAWYSAQDHEALAGQEPAGIVELVRIGGNRKVATFLSQDVGGEGYDFPDKEYVGPISYGGSLGASANLVPIGYSSNDKPEGWVEEPDPPEEPEIL